MPDAVTPSMAEAAKIRDVAARHAYVFDNGLCSPDFFDLPKRMVSEEFGLLRERIKPEQSVLEVGCFTGLNLLGLASVGHSKLHGVDFVRGAVEWLMKKAFERNASISARVSTFSDEFELASDWGKFDSIICFDVLEHQLNCGLFMQQISRCLTDGGRALFLVPIGKQYYDCGHVAFFPDDECLRNVLDYVFDVEEIVTLKSCWKMFASCRKRS